MTGLRPGAGWKPALPGGPRFRKGRGIGRRRRGPRRAGPSAWRPGPRPRRRGRAGPRRATAVLRKLRVEDGRKGRKAAPRRARREGTQADRLTVDKIRRSARLGSARLGSARLGSARLGSARLGSARLGSARLGSARLGSARLGSARLGSARLGSARLGSARLGSARLGSARLLIILFAASSFTSAFKNIALPLLDFRAGPAAAAPAPSHADARVSRRRKRWSHRPGTTARRAPAPGIPPSGSGHSTPNHRLPESHGTRPIAGRMAAIRPRRARSRSGLRISDVSVPSQPPRRQYQSSIRNVHVLSTRRQIPCAALTMFVY